MIGISSVQISNWRRRSGEIGVLRLPTVEEFKTELYRMMLEAVRAGKNTVDINAGELHRRVGDYPDPNRHRMPVCCDVMNAAFASDAGDKILQQPPSGQGASLTIRYVLPRP
jgi:hypothetical protein